MIVSVICLIFGVYTTNVPDFWSERLTEKVFNAVESTFTVSDPELIDISGSIITSPVSDSISWQDYLFEVRSGGERSGYIFVDQAASMKNVFDYIVLFDESLRIVNAKVLIYREQHGRQIGSKRWLSQFFGMDIGDEPRLGSNIDGISGATISVTNMTAAVRNLLYELNKVKSEILLS